MFVGFMNYDLRTKAFVFVWCFFSMSKDKVTKQEMSLFMMFNKSISKQLRVTSYLSPFRISCVREKIYILNYLQIKYCHSAICQNIRRCVNWQIFKICLNTSTGGGLYFYLTKNCRAHFFYYFKRISILHALFYVIQKKIPFLR